MGYKGRDVEVVPLNEEQYLVAACDSCGAIGEKEFDVVKVSWRVTGRSTARVALLEVLSVGAIPQMLTVAISCEPEPAGKEILKGVNEELKAMDMASLPIVISTEKNMSTKQTGLGISAVGLCDKANLRIGRSKSGNAVFCLGLPKVGAEAINPDDPERVQGSQVTKLLSYREVYDVIPVGSRGIRGEAEALAKFIGAKFIEDSQCKLDIDKSAGPSTCLIFTAPTDIELTEFETTPIHKIGLL